MKTSLNGSEMNMRLRIKLFYGVLLLILTIFIFRLFYLQILKHDYYKTAALANQLKQYEIPAVRGAIYAQSGDQVLPIVLNETRFTLYADPKFIEQPEITAQKISRFVNIKESELQSKFSIEGSRYQILEKQLTKDKAEQILDLKLKGIGTQPVNYRTYPQGSLAAQVLGFVNQDGVGTYGLEQALDSELRGKPGQLRAITDVDGVPLAANSENLEIAPTPGKEVLLTLDIGMQSQLRDILINGLKRAVSKSGSALIIDVKTGAIKALANYPSFTPEKYYETSDPEAFTNRAVSAPLEIGSVMKPFTAAAALDKGVVKPDTTYYDPAQYSVDGYKITNIEEDGGPGTRSVSDILQLSLNTGATWLLMQMGGGVLNEEGRIIWHDYMTDHFQFGKLTGIEQGYESGGTIPSPTDGYGLNLQYANTSFGQGMTATPVQVAAALASMLNGGTYYKPRLVEAYINSDGSHQTVEPNVVRDNVVSKKVSQQIVSLMQNVVDKNYLAYGMKQPDPQFNIGGKTGTAEIANPEGGYYADRFNGMFMGFVGGKEPQYAIVVRVDDPKIPGYAGSQAAAPIFGAVSEMLINNFNVVPK